MTADRWSVEAEAFVQNFIARTEGQEKSRAPALPPPDQPWWCQHPHTSLPRARQDQHGSVRHRRQCLSCGAPVGNQVSRTDAERENGGAARPFDEALYERGRQREEAARRAREAAHEAKRAAWWQWYDQYLKSPEWRARRDKVMRRANGICEGCLSRRAVHVHHKTYAHVGNELLFELAALCDGCHDLAHKDNPSAPPPSVWRGEA